MGPEIRSEERTYMLTEETIMANLLPKAGNEQHLKYRQNRVEKRLKVHRNIFQIIVRGSLKYNSGGTGSWEL